MSNTDKDSKERPRDFNSSIITEDGDEPDSTPILWSEAADLAFKESKQALVNATLLSFPQENVKLRLVTDASIIAAGAVLEQETVSGWKPLGFFSKKLTSGQKKYAPYDLELTAIFLAIKNFHSHLEGRDFDVLCDHKPFQYAFTQSPEQVPLIRQRQLSFISQYTMSIKYLPGKDNPVADALSRIDMGSASQDAGSLDAFALPTDISMKRLSEAQGADEELAVIISQPDFDLKLRRLEWLDHANEVFHIYCEIGDDIIRPYIPKRFRQEAISLVHNLSHSGPGATNKLIHRKFVWPNMSKDVKDFYWRGKTSAVAGRCSGRERLYAAAFGYGLELKKGSRIAAEKRLRSESGQQGWIDCSACLLPKKGDDVCIRISKMIMLCTLPPNLASFRNDERVIELLLRNGAGPNIADAKKCTALHLLCTRVDDNDVLVKTLFEINEANHRRVDIEARDKDGNTPLLLAFGLKNEKLTELLLRYGEIRIQPMPGKRLHCTLSVGEISRMTLYSYSSRSARKNTSCRRSTPQTNMHGIEKNFWRTFLGNNFLEVPMLTLWGKFIRKF
ncbi:unnamed protein product [Trichogramma brassicae]|uniref:RNA-directed DNA polymerase n=1 Tax=Trichogramma brassicae TaxID=86971 RepID=A0A6H5IUN8_9HYME|nr:unnamed protein product [Trichogramma brassicae]